MVDISKSNPIGTQRALGVQQVLASGRPMTPGLAAQASQAITPSAGQELQQAFQQYETAQQRQAKLQQAQTQTAAMKEMMGRQQQVFDVGQEAQRQLASIDARAKNEMLDMQLQFSRDASGQKYMSERQLMDWALTKSQSEEDFKNFQLNLEGTYAKKAQLMEAIYGRLKALEAQSYKEARLERSQTLELELAGMDRETQQKIVGIQTDVSAEIAEMERVEKERAKKAAVIANEKVAKMEQKAKNTTAMVGAFSQIFSAGGAAAGAQWGSAFGPWGVAGGAIAGGIAGGVLGKELGMKF